MSGASLIVIGNLDGVHRGHQALLARASDEASARGLSAKVLTFDPHPASVLGGQAPPLLTTPARKREIVEGTFPGVHVEVVRFDAALAAMSPEAFAREVLVARLGAKHVIVGRDFRFGRARAGDVDALRALGAALAFSVEAHDLVVDEGGALSSTRARQAIEEGDVEGAIAILGRPHMLSGVVVRGDQRGRTLGFPTCNLGGVLEALPASGVYAVAVDLADGEPPGTNPRALAAGVANIGWRPTVDPGATAPRVEAHLFDVDRDLYGGTLRVHLVANLRPEQKFAGLDELRAQIGRDAERARATALRALPEKPDGRPWF